MKRILLALAVPLFLSPLAASAKPGLLHVTESISIAAPPGKVWDTIKNYDALPSWHPAFAKDEIVKGSNNKTGAVRALTIKDGPTFTEELVAYHPRAHSFTYKIIESPLPLSAYRSTMSVRPDVGGKTLVVWTGTFRRKDPSASPKKGEDDKTATDLITGVYKAGLDNLKKMTEK